MMTFSFESFRLHLAGVPTSYNLIFSSISPSELFLFNFQQVQNNNSINSDCLTLIKHE